MSAVDVLSSIGEVTYQWSLPTDAIVWGGDVEGVLGIPVDSIPTGRAYASFNDSGNAASRQDAVFGSPVADRGLGVHFQIEYGLRPRGPAGPLLWVEENGRWYGDGSTPQRVVGVIRVITDRHERDQKLAFRSSHDELTGQFNRARLLELLGEAMANAQRFQASTAFLVIGIDSFRMINDAYGYDVANDVLAAVSRRVASKLRGGDALGRFSGNKLAVILEGGDDRTIRAAAERFLKVVRDEVVVTGQGSIAVTVSIGGVVMPRNARTVLEAIARAEESLHAARELGFGRFVAHTHAADRHAERQANAALSTELVTALAEHRIRLAYQPIVDIVTRRPVLYEALLRLTLPNGDVVPASAFMPVAERLGFARLLDHRALALALDACRKRPDLRLSLNVSPDTASEPTWLALLKAAAKGAPEIARRLTIEITESSAIRNLDEAMQFVSSLKALGCDVAFDDFGAGYTSFRNLRQLDIDIVKIDGAFIENIGTNSDDKVFVRALVELARAFELRTVAEKVADEESVAILAALGVDLIQGSVVANAAFEIPPA
ncbi:MAG: bifunctional diguanylate cyclase/phosphodiesterase [Bauldia sp.]|nr:bifunctional diguanylate cyclase/phosphodiesterase [Bauldia sp.]